MNQQVELRHGSAIARLRLTPWDQRSLGLRTAELLEITGTDSDLSELWTHIDSWLLQHRIEYSFGRIAADAPNLKEALQNLGYHFIETSMLLSRTRTDEWPRVSKSLKLELGAASPDDLADLRDIATNDFHHGRFLEDSTIQPNLARARTSGWLDDLHERENLKSARLHGKNIGFAADTLNVDGVADLILYGVSSNFPMLAVPLWVAALQRLNDMGAKRYQAMVSAANIPMINLYLRLGFSVTSVHYGFRKWHNSIN